MKPGAFPDDFKIEKDCLPVRIDTDGNKAVLCIHGYTSYPGIYDHLVPELEKAGFAVSVPRLPGHGTTGRDLLATNADEWLRCCVDEYINLKTRYRKIYICGQSMGGLLGLLLADMFAPDGLILLSPAVLPTNNLLPLTPLLRIFIKRYRSKFEVEWTRPIIKRLEKEYWNYTWVATAAELLKLIRKTKRALKRIDTPLFCIRAGRDRTVRHEACSYIMNRVKSTKKDSLVLENSEHNIMSGECIDEAAAEIMDWLSNLKSNR